MTHAKIILPEASAPYDSIGAGTEYPSLVVEEIITW
jgi:hypothetical protein